MRAGHERASVDERLLDVVVRFDCVAAVGMNRAMATQTTAAKAASARNNRFGVTN
ncbi:hypothetical protein SAMN04489742_1703 [Arthrobacter crystallopoietes]|uniref:Uncharacterized protein n=1 Tax=Crystallibacter crystallopoietes TaxID=37928 RepID=A0A1H1C2D6_9MICC|nr:hypothetical protein SAMN04489742_1703 [Arthrobacter crystallopoietes]